MKEKEEEKKVKSEEGLLWCLQEIPHYHSTP